MKPQPLLALLLALPAAAQRVPPVRALTPALSPAVALPAALPSAGAPRAAAFVPLPVAPAAAAPAAAAIPEFHLWSLPQEPAHSWTFKDPWIGAARLWDGAAPAQPLGAGAMGSVFVHPSRPEEVVKVARRGYAEAAGQYMAPDDEVVLAYEDYDLSRLAALGAAPRPLARTTVSDRPASVRERIRGETVASLARRGRFGPRERALVDELLARIAAGGYTARDLNLGNIMIGRRAGEKEDRAWLVDTLGVHAREGTDEARREHMLSERVPWLAFRGFGLARPLSRALDASVRRD